MEKSEEDIVQSYMEEAKSILRQEKPENLLKNALGLYKEEFLKNGIAEEVDGNMEFIAGTPFKASLDSLVEKISEVFPEKSKESELFKKVVNFLALVQTIDLAELCLVKEEIKFITFFMDNDGFFQIKDAIVKYSTFYVFEDFIANDEKYKFYYDREKDKIIYWNPELASVLVSMFGKENVERFSMKLVDQRHYNIRHWEEGIKEIFFQRDGENYSIHTARLAHLLRDHYRFDTVHEFPGEIFKGFFGSFFVTPCYTLFLSKVTKKETASQA